MAYMAGLRWSLSLPCVYIWIFLGLITSVASDASDVCPDAKYKKLPVIGDPAPSFDPFGWSSQQRESYIEDRLARQASPLVVALAVLLLTLATFGVWRLVRSCCVTCCDDALEEVDAEKKVAARTPCKRRLRIWQLLMLLLAGSAMGICAWGMIAADNGLVTEFWQAYAGAQLYVSGISAQMGALNASGSNVTAQLDRIDAVMATDVNFTAIEGDLKHVASFLDSSPSPEAFMAAITSLELIKDQQLIPAINKLNYTLNDPASDLRQLAAAVEPVAGAYDLLTTMHSAVSAYSTAVNAVAIRPPQQLSDVAALRAAQDGMTVDTWQANLTAMQSAVGVVQQCQQSQANPIAELGDQLTNITAIIAEIRDVRLPRLINLMTRFNGLYYQNASFVFASLIARVEHINATVMLLDASAQAAFDQADTAVVKMAELYAGDLSPIDMVAAMQALVSLLVMPQDVDVWNATLNSAAAAFDALPSASPIYDGIANVKTLLSAFSSSIVDTIGAALTTYEQAPTTPNALQLSSACMGSPPGSNALVLTQLELALDPTSVLWQTIQLQSISAGAAVINDQLFGTNGVFDMTRGAIATVDDKLGSLPSTAPVIAQLAVLRTVYDQLPTPKSKIITVNVTRALTALQGVVANASGTARAQVISLQASLSSGEEAVNVELVLRLDTLRQDWEPETDKYSGYVYDGIMVMYATLILLLLLVTVGAMTSCRGLLSFSIFITLVALVLLSVIPIVLTVALTAMDDTCYHAEELVVGLAPDRLELNGSGIAINITQFFADSGITDVAGLKASINNSMNAVVGEITSQYQMRPKMTDIFSAIAGVVSTILGQIDDIMAYLGYSHVNALYVSIKSWACCSVTEFAATHWTCTVVAGALAWILMLCGCSVLHILDSQHRSSSCYGGGAGGGSGGPYAAYGNGGKDAFAALEEGEVSVVILANRKVGTGPQSESDDGTDDVKSPSAKDNYVRV